MFLSVRRGRGALVALAGILFITGCPDLIADAGATTVRTYYVSPTGSDAASGTTALTPWRTLARASRATLRPGDRLLLRRSSTFRGALDVAESGASGSPIRIGAYGVGSKPVVTGDCVDVAGSHVVVTDLVASGCTWAGFAVSGDRVTLARVTARRNVAGVHIRVGANDAVVRDSRIVQNNRMSVNTPGGDDDSGAFGVLVRGDRAVITQTYFSGQDAASYDYGRDGSAVEIYGAVGTRVTANVAVDNNAFTELGNRRSRSTTYAGNTVRSHLATSTFLITRGAESSWGPVLDTRADRNDVRLTGARSEGFVCHAGCSPRILTMTYNVVSAVRKIGYADGPFGGGHNRWLGGLAQFAPLLTDVVIHQ